MQYYDRVSLKQQAKNSMKTTRPNVFIATLVYFLMLVVLSNLSYRLTGMDRLYGDLYELAGSGQTVDYGTMIQGYRDLIPTVAPFASLLAMIISLMNAVIGAGYAGYCLKVSRGEQTKVLDIFRSFDHFGKAVSIAILHTIFVFLWSLLFVVPGIIAAYRYSQAYYIMYDHPEYSAMRCLRESSRMMRGFKWKLFVLELSFIGWNLLNGLIEAFCYIGFLSIYIQPYTGLAHAYFYNFLAFPEQETDDAPHVWEPPV